MVYSKWGERLGFIIAHSESDVFWHIFKSEKDFEDGNSMHFFDNKAQMDAFFLGVKTERNTAVYANIHVNRNLHEHKIPLSAKTNIELYNLTLDVLRSFDEKNPQSPNSICNKTFERSVLWEVIKRLKNNEGYVRVKQKAEYKFKIGDVLEVYQPFSPKFGVELEGTWRLMKVMGFYDQESRVPEYWLYPVEQLHTPPPHHWWHKPETVLRIPMNPKDD